MVPQASGDNLLRVVPAFGAQLAAGAAERPRQSPRASAYMDILGFVMVRTRTANSRASCVIDAGC